MCSRRTGCAASFPPWPMSVWQQDGPCRSRRSSGIWRSWAWPEAPAAGVAAVRRHAPPGGHRRAVCAGPRLLLLDEAFKGLDEQCRRDTVAYIRRHTPGASLLCVTHDPEEAALLGGRCLDLSTL